MRKPKIAIVYDRINSFGGAERVLLALHEEFPQAPLFTSVCNRKLAKWLGDWKVYTTFLQNVPFAQNHHQWFGWAMPLAFETLDLSSYDVILSVTSEAAKGVLTGPNQIHICYCLTPTRYLWSHTHEYEGRHFGWLKRLFFNNLRIWDYIASKRPDIMIPISYRVKQRIEKYYHRDTEEVIYPPVEIPIRQLRDQMTNERSYFLVVSRLVPYKRVDLAIRASIQLGVKLKIVGTGSDEKRLRTIANGDPLIEFVGFVNDGELDEVYSHARGLICAQEEDFGIVSLEAQSRGVPVLSYAQSGIAETITEGETGLLFSDQSIDSLAAAMQKSMHMKWDLGTFGPHVREFSLDVFSKKMRNVVQFAIEKQYADRVM